MTRKSRVLSLSPCYFSSALDVGLWAYLVKNTPLLMSCWLALFQTSVEDFVAFGCWTCETIRIFCFLRKKKTIIFLIDRAGKKRNWLRHFGGQIFLGVGISCWVEFFWGKPLPTSQNKKMKNYTKEKIK